MDRGERCDACVTLRSWRFWLCGSFCLAPPHDLVRDGAAILAASLTSPGDFPTMVVGIGGSSDVLVEQEAHYAAVLIEQSQHFSGQNG